MRWPIMMPEISPGLMIGYAMWCFFPSIHAETGMVWPGAIAWGGGLLLLPMPWIAHQIHRRALAAIPQKTAEEIAREEAEQAEAHQRQLAESFGKLTADSPLREWWRFVEMEKGFRSQSLQGARGATSRQSEAAGRGGAGPQSL